MNTDEMIISIKAHGVTHTITCSADANSTILFEHFVSLAKCAGYMLSSIDKALVAVGADVADELNVERQHEGLDIW
jgi:hypothetical protein